MALKDHLYWWMAEECLRRAEEANSSETRACYVALAGSWRALADPDAAIADQPVPPRRTSAAIGAAP